MSGGQAIHVIERNPAKTVKKQFDAKSEKADQKRLQSLNKMKDSYTQQKQAIKAALSSVVCLNLIVTVIIEPIGLNSFSSTGFCQEKQQNRV